VIQYQPRGSSMNCPPRGRRGPEAGPAGGCSGIRLAQAERPPHFADPAGVAQYPRICLTQAVHLGAYYPKSIRSACALSSGSLLIAGLLRFLAQR